MINTLIVDDSSLARDILRDFLEGDAHFKIIGEAVDGEDAVQKILSLNPDLVTLDIDMPKMNGLEVIEVVLKKIFIPIVVITSHGTAKNAYEATIRGALEFYSKNIFSASLTPEKRQEIYETLKRISSVKAHKTSLPIKQVLQPPPIKRAINAVVMASSTGGPKALSRFFSLLPEEFPVPIALVQHNSSGFDKSFAQWLSAYTSLKVKIAEDGEAPKAGTVYIAETDRHLAFKKTGGQGFCLYYNDDEPKNNQKPAADVLFQSAAECLRQSVISVVLTGMGSDGALGTRQIRAMGGITLAQDEASSLIYGMPKAAAETGCVDSILPLERIPEELVRLTK